ncbi:hypothetical protein GL218_08761 [Daldinia childiae]|uniref:uncharacterized protein n=1 Tax=Daldinia childiae TaxID=326645 RepID=UPI0014467060|nr:uncharacterized protein GL218_05174 [Daldinia childiae]XP_033440228.1 uncharacterized protein GL218_08761 [Daldinia childiae]KAF3059928.1 hypothetical protein GL218_05174 [Daldinia childiae]KAF3067096.1 hypothetical protein GL218_08761 [Daldinia childiae]
MAASVPLDELIPFPTEVNDTHKVYRIAAACIALCIVTTGFVVARLTLRARSKNLGPDDYAIIPATILYIGWSSLAAYINLNAGVDKPLWEITIAEYSLWYKGIVATAWLYPIMSGTIRVSITLFYLRIFGHGNNVTIRRILYAFLALQGVYVVVFSITPIWACQPLYWAWDPLQHPLHCNDLYYTYSTIGLYSVSLAYDVVLLLFPIYPVLKLNMGWRRRIGILVIFMLGAAASIAAALKLALFVDGIRRFVVTDPVFFQYLASRFIAGSFAGYGETFWIPSQVEPTVALIGASLPALGHSMKLVAGRVTKVWSSLTSTSKTTTYDSQSNPPTFGHKQTPSKGGFQPLNESQIELRDTGRSKVDSRAQSTDNRSYY